MTQLPEHTRENIRRDVETKAERKDVIIPFLADKRREAGTKGIGSRDDRQKYAVAALRRAQGTPPFQAQLKAARDAAVADAIADKTIPPATYTVGLGKNKHGFIQRGRGNYQIVTNHKVW